MTVGVEHDPDVLLRLVVRQPGAALLGPENSRLQVLAPEVEAA